ncbi:MAG: hypothetical protein QOE14_1325 [Humisphaera sp.]|nr:hypothetical protein [Humisphaera sp.]
MTDRAYVATRKGVFTLTRKHNNDKKWAIDGVSFLGDNASIVAHDPRDGAVYVALGHGHFGVKMHRSDDGGVTWKPIATPEYPPPPALSEGEEPQKDFWGRPMPTTLQLVWCLEPGGNPGELWCGTIPGALFHSTDRGESWRRVDALWNHPLRKHWTGGGADYPGIHSVCVNPRDPKHVSVGVSCGGMWVTRDGGETWNCKADGMRAEYKPPDKQFEPNVQDPHRIVQCPANTDAMWAQHHNGIFRTTNGGEQWSEIKPAPPFASAFGFAVCVHPKHGDTAWFVPAVKDEHRIPVDGKIAVTRTRDGGKSFDVLRDGLPQEHAYDLVFRHGMDIDTTGERLVFGSTTGSLWITENAGDSWETIARNLPPIYCVRFANV